MLLAQLLWIWVFTTAPAVATLHTPAPQHPHPLLLSRLDRLESLLADHQAQFQHERERWEKEKQILREDVHLLQENVLALQREKQEVRGEMEALQHKQTLTQTLAAENQDLKTQLGHLQHRLLSMEIQQQSLQDQVARCERNACRTDTGGDEDLDGEAEDQHAPGEQSAQVATTSEREGNSRQVNHPRASDPVRLLGDPDQFQQHVQSARSDDQGPLQVVVDHLAQTTAKLTADLQALSTQHSGDVQALRSKHSSDVQALTTQHSSDVQALRTQHSSDVQALRSQANAIHADRGSTFVQWGSSTCAGSSELVYYRAAGGSFYKHSGAAANTLCLTMNPRLTSRSSEYYALLYGAEYETYDSHQDTEAVCAVCRSPHPTSIMVPGTNVCTAGWTLQYSGFLMAGHYTQYAATEFICVDTKLEGAMGSSDDDDGHLLYFTKTQCGSLPCPPYTNGKVVTCAVCSK